MILLNALEFACYHEFENCIRWFLGLQSGSSTLAPEFVERFPHSDLSMPNSVGDAAWARRLFQTGNGIKFFLGTFGDCGSIAIFIIARRA